MTKFISITRGTIFNDNCRVIELLDKTFVYLDRNNNPQVMSFHYWKQMASKINNNIYVDYYNRGKLIKKGYQKTFYKLDQ